MIYIKKLRLILILLLAAAVVGFAALLTLNGIVKHRAKPYILDPDSYSGESFDCILILGCGVYGDRPSHMLSDRLDRGVQLFDLKLAPKLLLSGDNSRADYNEVAVMRDVAASKGVPLEAIFMDHAGFSTYESMYRARDIFDADRVLIVTQSYHLYRAVYDARALGLDAYGVDADLRAYAGQTFRDLREVLARVKDFAWCIFKPEPTYLGEKIPVSGTGNAAKQ